MGIFLFLGIFLFSFQLQMGVLLLESAAYHPPGCIYIYPRGGVSRGRSLGRTWVVSALAPPSARDNCRGSYAAVALLGPDRHEPTGGDVDVFEFPTHP